MLEAVALADPPRTADGHIDVDALTDAVARTTGATPWLLDSPRDAPGGLGWSALVLRSTERMTVRSADQRDPFGVIAELCERAGLDPHAARSDDQPPCDGGLVGAISYDAARHIERLPTEAVVDRPTPLADMVLADTMVVVEHEQDRATVVHRGLPRRRPAAEVRAAVDELRSALRTGAPTDRTGATSHTTATTTLGPPAYRAAVRAVLERIAAGDTFQVNLAQRLTSRWDGDTLSLYRALREVSAAPYGAVLGTAGGEIASVSPETFVEVRSGRVTIRPIKGTRPRSDDPATDAALAEALRTSPKDIAENVMVVDMERNDLGRVCVEGSVHVPRLTELEAHPTVWHLVSDVVGELRPDAGWAELLRATFPCGSVTGAPKISSMGIIDRLEPVRRGWYCGAFGWLGAGAASTAVAIRTAVRQPDGSVDLGAGGGVVADSSPHAEQLESLDKAAAFLQVTGGVR